MDKDLKPLRDQIDETDRQLLELLNQRARLAQEVGHVKEKTNAPVYRPEREAQVLRALADRNPGPLLNGDLQQIFRQIISACRALELRVKVAYLGPTGTYSEQAVTQQFGSAIDGVPCTTLDEVFRATEAGAADFGVVPVENSTEGAINRTLDLLLQTSLTISSEISIPVHHCLMTQSGSMEGVTAICAHVQALSQCQGWLNLHYPDVERHAVSSNGEAARLASEDASVAAVAGEMAGQKYGLKVVNTNIQDAPNNRTRFVVIGRLQTAPSGKDQTSLVFSVPNEAGSVYRTLKPLATHGVSMTRFESRPARTGSWEYNFFVDVEGHAQDEKVAAALTELKAHAAYFKLLGSYPSTL